MTETEKPKVERIILILLHLIRNRHRRFTATDIYEWLNRDEPVSLRNVQRDLKKLAETRGTCVTSMASGKKLFYFIEPDMRGNLEVPIGKNSLLALFLLKRLQLFFAPGARTLTELTDALQEMGSEIGDTLFEDLDQKLEDDVHIIGQHSLLSMDNNLLDILISSVINRKMVDIVYKRIDDKTVEHRICPVKFFMASNDLYIAGIFPVSASRVYYFKLCRLTRVTAVDKAFELTGKQLNKVNNILHSSFGILDKENPAVTKVTLQFPGWFGTILNEKRFHASQVVRIKRDGNVLCTFTVPIGEELVRWILSWADIVKIVSPVSLKKKVNEAAKEFLKRNKQ